MRKLLLWLCILCSCVAAFAHPMPGSVVELSVLDNYIRGEAKIPLLELGDAIGDDRMANISGPFFKAYFTQHIQASTSGKPWATQIENIEVSIGKDPFIGVCKEAVVHFALTPPGAKLLHRFTFN